MLFSNTTKAKIATGIVLLIVGLFLTVVLTDTLGSIQTFGPAFTAAGLGVYFLGLDLAVNGILDSKPDENSTQSNQIDERLQKIEDSMNSIEVMVKKWDFI